MALALLMMVSFFIGYRLNIIIYVKHLRSGGKAVVLRHLPSLTPPM